MRITHLKINGLVNPLGWQLEHPTLTYLAEDAVSVRQDWARIRVATDPDMQQIVYDTGMDPEITGCGYLLPIQLQPFTRYFWYVEICGDSGETARSETAWFETTREVTESHREWKADWITPDTDVNALFCLKKTIPVEKPVARARMCMVGLGVYEFYLNGAKQGNECLLPGFCNYDAWIPYQTFAVDLVSGANELCVMLGNGWYKGWYGLNKKKENYGDRLALIAELHIFYEDGTEDVIGTDESWTAVQSPVVYDGIYSGEIYDARLEFCGMQTAGENLSSVITGSTSKSAEQREEQNPESVISVETTDELFQSAGSDALLLREPGTGVSITVAAGRIFPVRIRNLDKEKLVPRLNPRILVQERLRPAAVLTTPKGETVLDLGQNMVGWPEFRCSAPKGHRIHMQFGEILQDGCFYNDNLRTAPAEFIYISDGTERLVRPHFTFFGFRYVKVEGWIGEIDPKDFTGLVIHSEMERIGRIRTSDPLVNQLFENAWWGQKGNFLDVPTDCPQRDERYGWTGDAQIFSGTALYNADAYAFYTKFGKDLYTEQQALGGSVPDVVPSANCHWDASAAWGDAVTIIPWNVYLHTGNKEILRRQYPSMKGWVDYIRREDLKYGDKYLWQTGFQYGDWLALDGKVKGGVYGATDPHFIASAYYYYSAKLTAKAADVLGYEEDAAAYDALAGNIYDAFVREYYTPAGKLCVDTMTGYVVALFMGLTPGFAKQNNREGLMKKLRQNNYHLETGFVGTAYLCRVLSDNHMNDLAYHLLLEKGYPGWLYEVRMGATTIWERWDSVLPDGKISGTEMNSLNHYAYGAIVEWMYRYMIGIRPMEEGAGFRKFILAPKPNYQIRKAEGEVLTAGGRIRSSWEILADGQLSFRFEVPFHTEAKIILPDAEEHVIRALAGSNADLSVKEHHADVVVYAPAGTYIFTYRPTTPYRKIYSLDTPLAELKENPKTRKVLEEDYFSVRGSFPFEKELCTLREHLNGPFTSLPHEKQEEIDRKLREII